MQSSALVLKRSHFSLLFYAALKIALWLAHLTLHSTNTPLCSLSAATVLSLPDKTGSFLQPGEILNEESHKF